MQEEKLGFPSWPQQAPIQHFFQTGPFFPAVWDRSCSILARYRHLKGAVKALNMLILHFILKTTRTEGQNPSWQLRSPPGAGRWGAVSMGPTSARLRLPTRTTYHGAFPIPELHLQPVTPLPLIPPVWSQQTEGFCDPRSPSKPPRWCLQPTGPCTHTVVLALCLVTGGRTPRGNECGVMLLIKNSLLDLCTFDSIYATRHWCSHLYGLQFSADSKLVLLCRVRFITHQYCIFMGPFAHFKSYEIPGEMIRAWV